MSEKAISLKGHGGGYEIIINPDQSMSQAKEELKVLLKRLYEENKDEGKEVSFDISTQTRLLTAEQKQGLEQIFSDFPLFSIHKINASVIETNEALGIFNKFSIHPVSNVIRNGQVETFEGNVLFTGDIHKGGILRATGNIFLLGHVEGILSAGFPNDTNAVIVGNFSTAQQVRIADLVDIFDESNVDKSMKSVVYVNDLHDLDFTEIRELKTVRPKIFAKIGGF